jgi:hypothetical protein
MSPELMGKVFLRSAIYTMQWMRWMMICCCIVVKEDGNVRSDVRKMKTLTVKIETVTLIGKGR